MNGIINRIFLACALLCTLASCLEVEEFVQQVHEYVPAGRKIGIDELKMLEADAVVAEEVYVQGVVTSSDAEGNNAQRIVFQDGDRALSVVADLSASNELFPVGQKISVQCRNMVVSEIGGVRQLCASVRGEGLQKSAVAIDNRTARATVFAVGGGTPVEPKPLRLSQLDADRRAFEDCLVALQGVFFQTRLLPFANQGGSSEQLRTLYDSDGHTALLCTSDGATMAAEMLPEGKGTVTGILTYPNGLPVVMIRTLGDIAFSPSSDCVVNDPEDVESEVILSEYYAANGACYIEIFNTGTRTVDLSEYSLASDRASDGVFDRTLALDPRPLGPFGMVVYCNDAAAGSVVKHTTDDAAWDPLRTNYSSIRLDPLGLDGNSQVALLKNGAVADLLSTTNKYGWAAGRTLVRRPNIRAHSKASDFTRADAGWITRVAAYAYNLGHHRFLETDPDFDAPATPVPTTILDLRSTDAGPIATPLTITGRVTSDRTAGNVAPNRLFMQDGSNRGICVAFREGQEHRYDAGDEITVELYGSELVSEEGLWVVRDCVYSRSENTGSPNRMPEPLEASVSQIANLQSMYICIKDVQANASSLGQHYGAGAVRSEDLFANEFWISTLREADFAADPVSERSGTVCGIGGVAGDRAVVMPRNRDDLRALTAERFAPIVAEPVAVAALRDLAQGTIAQPIRVTVTVATDNSGGNMPSNRIFVQDAADGFLLELPGENGYAFGQTLIVVLEGARLSKGDELLVTPAAASSVVAIGAPDPSLQPLRITPSQMAGNLYKLVTITDLQVDESCRLGRFDASVRFNARGIAAPVNVVTEPTATWRGGYIPTASGAVTGLLSRRGEEYVLTPRTAADLAALPRNGVRHDGEKVVYFVPSSDPAADLFISETVMGDLDANGALLSSVARNKCNSKFVELYNPTDRGLPLSDYRVACIKYNNSVSRSDIAYYRFPEGLVLTPGRTVVFKYVSNALGTGTASFMTNTLWPKGYTGDNALQKGVTVDTDAVAGVILCLDARDWGKSVANSTQAFPAFDGNDILVVQKTADDGATWTEIDRLFSLPTADGTFTGKVAYPFLQGYQRKPGRLGLPGLTTDVQDAAYTDKSSGRNPNDFESTRCNPASGAVADWTPVSLGDTSDLGVHAFSVE